MYGNAPKDGINEKLRIIFFWFYFIPAAIVGFIVVCIYFLVTDIGRWIKKILNWKRPSKS